MGDKRQSKIHKIRVSKDKNPNNETLKNWKQNIKLYDRTEIATSININELNSPTKRKYFQLHLERET